MMVDETVRLQKLLLLKSTLVDLYAGCVKRLPMQPDLFLTENDMPPKERVPEWLICFYFLKNKNSQVSIEYFSKRTLTRFDLLALAVYKKYFTTSKFFDDLIDEYPEIGDDTLWFE